MKLVTRRQLSKTACYLLVYQNHNAYLNTFCCSYLVIKTVWLNSLLQTRPHRFSLLLHCTVPWSSRSRDAIGAQFPFHQAQTLSSSPVSRITPFRLPLHQARVPQCGLIAKMRVRHSCSLHHSTPLWSSSKRDASPILAQLSTYHASRMRACSHSFLAYCIQA